MIGEDIYCDPESQLPKRRQRKGALNNGKSYSHRNSKSFEGLYISLTKPSHSNASSGFSSSSGRHTDEFKANELSLDSTNASAIGEDIYCDPESHLPKQRQRKNPFNDKKSYSHRDSKSFEGTYLSPHRVGFKDEVYSNKNGTPQFSPDNLSARSSRKMVYSAHHLAHNAQSGTKLSST